MFHFKVKQPCSVAGLLRFPALILAGPVWKFQSKLFSADLSMTGQMAVFGDKQVGATAEEQGATHLLALPTLAHTEQDTKATLIINTCTLIII